MATAAQVEANRANAQKSTGPRTEEGKERASQNALKHGLFAREGVIRGEDEDEFEMHRERLLGQLNPVGPLEEILADRIVDLAWRLKRAVQDQTEAFAALYERQTAEMEEPREPVERAALVGRMILEDFSQNAVLERLLRYERRIENSLYRTLNQLRRVHDQLLKADLEDAKTLERWREEDWEARKARMFGGCPPVDVSPGPDGGATNTAEAEVPHAGAGPSRQDTRAASDGPPEDETGKTSRVPGVTGGGRGRRGMERGRIVQNEPNLRLTPRHGHPCSGALRAGTARWRHCGRDGGRGADVSNRARFWRTGLRRTGALERFRRLFRRQCGERGLR